MKLREIEISLSERKKIQMKYEEMIDSISESKEIKFRKILLDKIQSNNQKKFYSLLLKFRENMNYESRKYNQEILFKFLDSI